ncbi:MAG: methyltransferase domain-containing protein [Rugosibacter sp.]|nr:MAG: methyltransferase domain-containing protein [Rugosibacter sp.]
MDITSARDFLGEVISKHPFPENAYEAVYLQKHMKRYKDSCDLIAANCPVDQPLLSAGCEPGHIEMLLKQFYGFTNVSGLSYRTSDEFIARMAVFGIPILQCDLENDPIPCKDGQFSSIVFLETMEHMFNGVPFALKEMRRAVSGEGCMVLSTPNLAQLRNRWKLLKGKSVNWPLHGTKNFFGQPVHLRHNREYTVKELDYLLQQAGFQTVSRRYRDYSPRVLMRFFNSLYPTFKGIMFFVARPMSGQT